MRAAQKARKPAQERRETVVRLMVGLNLVSLLAAYISGHWDAVEHSKGAVDRFWYPPHFGIYFSLLVAAIVSSAGLVLVLRAPGTLGQKLRRHAALTTLVIANVISVTGAPFDAWWHETFGIDLTVWSPPHLHLLLGMLLAILGCSVYFLDDRPTQTPLRWLSSLNEGQMVVLYTFVLTLLMSVYFFVEYEGGLVNAEVLARPAWSYPVLWTVYSLFWMALFVASSRRLGLATLASMIYVTVRLLTLGIDRAVLGYSGWLFYPLVIPAIAFEALLAYAWPRWGDQRPWLAIASTGLVVSAILAITVPMFWTAMDILPQQTAQPWSIYWPAALIAGPLAALAGWGCGIGLRKLRPNMRIVAASMRQAVLNARPVEVP